MGSDGQPQVSLRLDALSQRAEAVAWPSLPLSAGGAQAPRLVPQAGGHLPAVAIERCDGALFQLGHPCRCVCFVRILLDYMSGAFVRDAPLFVPECVFLGRKHDARLLLGCALRASRRLQQCCLLLHVQCNARKYTSIHYDCPLNACRPARCRRTLSSGGTSRPVDPVFTAAVDAVYPPNKNRESFAKNTYAKIMQVSHHAVVRTWYLQYK